MHFATQSGLLLAAATLLTTPTFAGNSCGPASHCSLPRWIPETTDSLDFLGAAVDYDGDTAVVGAPGKNAVYVYERQGAHWSQVAALLDPFGQGHNFGADVGVAGKVLVVGAPTDNTLVTGAGAAHIFERIGGFWTFTQTVFDSTPSFNGRFGHAVDVSGFDPETTGEWIGIGAPGDNGGTGSCTSYYRFDAGWTFNAQTTWQADGQFGSALAIRTGSDLGPSAQFFIGSWGNDLEGINAGAVHRFEMTTGWNYAEGIITLPELQSGDYFGHSLACDGEHLLVGAIGDDEVATDAGAAYIFEMEEGSNPQITFVKKLLPCEGSTGSHFGWSVDIDGPNAAISAPNQEVAGTPGGSVHIYWPGFLGTWELAERITPHDGVFDDNFGQDVAVVGNKYFVGAPGVGAPNGDMGGAAYLISRQANLPGGECPCEAIAMSDSFGSGKPGSLGTPLLTASAPIPGKTTTIALKNALPGVAPILIWGLVPAELPFDDGTLHIADPRFAVMPVVSVLQQTGLGWSVPAGPSMCGLDVYTQGIFLDPGAAGPYHTAQSNALRLSVGY